MLIEARSGLFFFCKASSQSPDHPFFQGAVQHGRSVLQFLCTCQASRFCLTSVACSKQASNSWSIYLGTCAERLRCLQPGEMANTTATCKTMAATSNGVWQGDVPIHFALPLLIVQIVIVVTLTRALAFVLKPLRQPRVIAEIIVSPPPSPSNPLLFPHPNPSRVSQHQFRLSDCCFFRVFFKSRTDLSTNIAAIVLTRFYLFSTLCSELYA